MFRKALLIYNHHAGKAGADKRLGDAVAVLAPHIAELVLRQIEFPGDGERICRSLSSEIEAVFILGGDGTVHECMNGLASLPHPPSVGILPGGTCNDFSRSLGIPQDIPEAARMLLEGTSRSLDIGVVNDRVFTNFCGLGLITETSENIDPTLKNSLGKLSYFISTLQTLRSAQPFRFTMVSNGEGREEEAIMILVANGRYLGTHPLPLQPDSLCDGHLDVLIIREAGLPLLKELLARKSEEPWEPKDKAIEYFRATSLTIQTHEPMKVDTDGEIYLQTPIELSLLTTPLKLLVGAG